MSVLWCAVVLVAVADPPKKEVIPHPTRSTFFIRGVETDACIEAITASLKKSIPTFTKIEGLTTQSGFANVSFDSHAQSFHQIAQAIADAGETTGKKYEVSIRFRIPEFEQFSEQINAVFKKLEDKVKIEPADKGKGEFIVHFLPLKVDPDNPGRQGFNFGQVMHPVKDPPPKGLGTKIILHRESLPATPEK